MKKAITITYGVFCVAICGAYIWLGHELTKATRERTKNWEQEFNEAIKKMNEDLEAMEAVQ